MEKRIIIFALIIISGCGIFLAAPKLYKAIVAGSAFYVDRLPGLSNENNSETTSTTSSETSPIKEETETFSFYDVRGEYHEANLNTNAAFNSYSSDYFKSEEGILTYTEDGYTTRQGIDVSAHQGEIDWKKVAESGIDFVIIRCGFRGYGLNSGVIKEDKYFEANYKGAKAVGLDIGVYFFSQAINEEEALEEADYVLSVIDGKDIALGVVFDPESILDDVSRTDDVTGEQFTKNSIAFCERVKEKGYTPMMYANLMWQAYTLDMAALKSYVFWYADYSEIPQSPYDFSTLQYTEKGTVAGIEGAVDRNLLIVPVN